MTPARPKQFDCRYEPDYPGLDTVLFSIRATHLTAHAATARCRTETPHQLSECGEWLERRPVVEDPPTGRGGPCLQGREPIGDGGFRRIAPPAP